MNQKVTGHYCRITNLVLISATTCAYDLATISSSLTMTSRSPTFSPARLAGPPSFTSLTKIVSIGLSYDAPVGEPSRQRRRLSVEPVSAPVNNNNNSFGGGLPQKLPITEKNQPPFYAEDACCPLRRTSKRKSCRAADGASGRCFSEAPYSKPATVYRRIAHVACQSNRRSDVPQHVCEEKYSHSSDHTQTLEMGTEPNPINDGSFPSLHAMLCHFHKYMLLRNQIIIVIFVLCSFHYTQQSCSFRKTLIVSL